jgi:type I restriction enzyme S subunit
MSVPDGFKVSEVGVIPVDWEAVLLDSVAKRGSGHTPDKKHSEYWNGNIKWISLKDSNRFDQIYIYDTTEKITMAGIANSSAVLHPSESVVLSRDAGVGKSAITKDVMAVSQHFFAWQCGLQLDNHFLYYWFQFKKSEFERIAIGTTIKTIGIPYFQKLKIPLPPLTEQKAIAQSLSDVDNLITAIDKLITKKRNIKQGTMQELLTGKKRLPGFSGEWEVKKLGECCSKITDGTHDTPKPVDKGVPFLTAIHVKDGFIDFNNCYFLPQSIHEVIYKRCNPEKNDVLMVNIGAGVATTALINVDYEFSLKNVALLKTNKNILIGSYLHYCLSFNKFMITNNLINGGAQPFLSLYQIGNITIPLPPLPEQKAIAKILTEMDAEIEALEKKREKYKNIKQGMMQELLTGKTRIIDN